MITSEDILNMNFYKKEKFTGSYLGMRYLIQKSSTEIPAEDSNEDSVKSVDIFRVCIWPGPYNFASTPEEMKTYETFPFTTDGKQQVVDWMNAQWRQRESEWPAR